MIKLAANLQTLGTDKQRVSNSAWRQRQHEAQDTCAVMRDDAAAAGNGSRVHLAGKTQLQV